MFIFDRTIMDGHSMDDAHGRLFSVGRTWTLIFSRTVIFGRTLMDADFWQDAHGRSYLVGLSWTLMYANFM